MIKSNKGFIPVMLTPFKQNGSIDYEALTQLVEFYLEAGVSGLFANCLSSEMYELDPGERLQLVTHIMKTVNAQVPVVATGSFGDTIGQQAEFIEKMYQTGVNAVIVVTNKMARQDDSDEVFNEHMHQLMDLTNTVPLGFYECPLPYKRLITSQQIEEFAKGNRLIYLKDTCMDIGQVKAKLNAANDYKMELYDAYMGHAVASLKAGAAGLSCIQGNYWPELIVWLCRNYDHPELQQEVNVVQRFFIDHMEVMHHVYPITAKYYLEKRGLQLSSFTRQNVGVFNTQVRSKIDKLYADYINLQQDLCIR